MADILKVTKINLNPYKSSFDLISVEDIDTYVINSDSSGTHSIWSISRIEKDDTIETLLIRHLKKNILLFRHCRNTEETLNTEVSLSYDRNTTERIEKVGFKSKIIRDTVVPCSDQDIAEIIDDEITIYQNNELEIGDREEIIQDLKECLGKIYPKSFQIDFDKIDELVWVSWHIVAFVYNGYFYHIVLDFGAGHMDNMVFYQDSNLMTFTNKRFSYYPYEFVRFLPHISGDEKSLKNLNSFLFDNDMKNLVVCCEKENEYDGIKNTLTQFYMHNQNLATKIYQSLFRVDIGQDISISSFKDTNLTIEYAQEVSTEYQISYNYAVLIFDELVYTICWDNY